MHGLTLLTILALALVQGCSENICEDGNGGSAKLEPAYHACARECQSKDNKAECSCSSRCPCWGRK